MALIITQDYRWQSKNAHAEPFPGTAFCGLEVLS